MINIPGKHCKTLFLLFCCTVFTAHGQSFSSGKVNTRGKFAFRYGRIEASIKLPKTANGLWPAFWLLGADYPAKEWPACGEIDVMEMGHFSGIESGVQDRLFNGAAHWGIQTDGGHPSHVVFRTNLYGLQFGGFHLFTLVKNERRISMYLDLDKLPEELKSSVKPYFEITITPELEPFFNKAFFLVLNLAVGGDYPGIYDPAGISALNAGNNNQASMYIDFVRVYDEAGTLVFNDEFNGSRLDSAKWSIEENGDGGGNNELQRYRRENVRVEKDRTSGKNCLVLTAKKGA